MDKTLAAEPSAREASEMIGAITRYIAEIDKLRDEMSRDQEAIDKSGERTDAILAEITELLEALRAA